MVQSYALIALTMYSLYNFLSRAYAGVVVCKLPFVPISILQGMSHSGIMGTDYSECSFMFIFVVAGLGFRANVQRMLGVKQPPTPWSTDTSDE